MNPVSQQILNVAILAFPQISVVKGILEYAIESDIKTDKVIPKAEFQALAGTVSADELLELKAKTTTEDDIWDVKSEVMDGLGSDDS